MTNQNVVAPLAVKSRVNKIVELAVSISNSTLSLPRAPVPESITLLGGFLNQYQKRLLFTLEENGNGNDNGNGGGKGGVKVNAWIDSMRASSPTRVKSSKNNAPSSENPWILRHPSALDMFDEIIRNSKGKQIVTFLDYDGTLSPIVADPDKAFMTKKMRATLKDIAKHFPAAIVSGRCIDKVYNFVRLGELYYAGSHGMDIKGPTKGQSHMKGNEAVLFQPASQLLPMIDEVYKILVEKTKCVPGARVENNKFCLSVHFRCVDEKSWPALAEQVKSVLQEYPKLKLTQGRKVLEIRPTIKWDKGKAIEFLLESLGYGNSNNVFPIYIGDDRTDEDAFKVLRSRGQGIGILVSQIAKETEASYTLQDPSQVGQFLRRLAEWKKASCHSHKLS